MAVCSKVEEWDGAGGVVQEGDMVEAVRMGRAGADRPLPLLASGL
jgi:hypothetical protein